MFTHTPVGHIRPYSNQLYRRQHQISVSVVGQLSLPLARPVYTPDKFDALLYRSDYDLGIVHRLELTLAARGLRL